MKQEKLYTAAEVADILGVHLQTVRKWYSSGQLECYKIGRVRISESQLQKFLRAREQCGQSQSEGDGGKG